MAQALAIESLAPPPSREPTVERFGGALVSFFFHLALLALLLNLAVPRRQPPPPPATVHLSIAPTPAAPDLLESLVEPRQEALPEPLIDEAVRTSNIGEERDHIPRDHSEFTEIGDPGLDAPQGAESETPPTSTPELPEYARDPNRRELVVLNEETRRLLAERTEIAQADLQRQFMAQERIRGRLFQEEEELPTRNADYLSEGAPTGHVREFDFTGISPVIVRQVLQRYGASLDQRRITGDEIANQGPITLNAARFGGEVLTAHRESGSPGVYMTLTYGSQLAARLVEMEWQELAHRGINISRVALTRTVYTIDQRPGGHELIIRDIEYVEINR